VSSSKINLNWTDNAGNEAGFKIERSTDGATFSQVGVVGANGTSFSNLNHRRRALLLSRSRLRWSEPLAVLEYCQRYDASDAGGPSNLAAVAVSSSQINLTWTDNAIGETGFKLERSTDGVNFTQVASLGKNSQKYTTPDLRRAPPTTTASVLRWAEPLGILERRFRRDERWAAAPSNLTATAYLPAASI
jgi:titin